MHAGVATGVASPLNVVGAFLRRDITNARSYRLPFVLDLGFGILQYCVYYFLSRTFAGTASATDLAGAPNYFAFAAVGLLMALIVESATQGLSERLRDDQLSGNLETLLIQPVTATSICAGYSAFPVAFAIFRLTLYLLVLTALGIFDLQTVNWTALSAVVGSSAIAFSSVGVIGGSLMILFRRGNVVLAVFIFAMTLASGTVFPANALPAWLEAVGRALPLRHALDGARAALFGEADWQTPVLTLVAIGCVGLIPAVKGFDMAIGHARRTGSIGKY